MGRIKDKIEEQRENFNDIEYSWKEYKSFVTEMYGKLMERKITNEEFEEATGCIPTKNNPSYKAWKLRNGYVQN